MAVICPGCGKQYDVTLFQFGRGTECDCGCILGPNEMPPVRIPVNGVLDLHNFRPDEVKSLIPEYVEQCMERGIFRIRIIHGKGKGVLKRTVQSVLRDMSEVASFRDAGPYEGGWGATLARLRSARE